MVSEYPFFKAGLNVRKLRFREAFSIPFARLVGTHDDVEVQVIRVLMKNAVGKVASAPRLDVALGDGFEDRFLFVFRVLETLTTS